MLCQVSDERFKLPDETKPSLINLSMMGSMIHNEMKQMYPDYANAIEILDYNLCRNGEVLTKDMTDLPVFAWVNTGGCEGIYIDWYLGRNREHYIGTFKTLEEDSEAYGKMGLIAGYLTRATEVFMWKNYGLLSEATQ